MIFRFVSDLDVYNFGISGYGVLHYNYLLDNALALEPKCIIIGLYPPNDLIDVCSSINNVDYWKKWAINNRFNLSFIILVLIASCIRY